jgi:sentrin-specific protease 1
MNMLMERGEKDNHPKCYAFNTFFYPKIMSGGHSTVRRWTKKVDIFSYDYIIIPIHLGMHWCLCVSLI